MDRPLRILLVDDNPDDRTLIGYQLSQEFPGVHIEQAIDPDELRYQLDEGNFDLVVTDYQIRWTNGLKVLFAVKEKHPDIPVIMFTATGSEEVAVEAMKSGLDDYVLKSSKHYPRLRAAVRLALERKAQRQAIRQAESKYRELFDKVPVGLFRTSPEGRFLDANPALIKINGESSLESLRNTGVAEYYYNKEDRERFKAIIEKEGIVVDFEAKCIRRDRTVYWTSVSARAFRDDEGRILYYDGSLMDITARKQAELRVQTLLKNLRKRIKELNCLFSISKVIFQNPDRSRILQETANLIPSGMQHSEDASARIIIGDSVYTSPGFQDSHTVLSAVLQIERKVMGRIEVFYPDGKYGSHSEAFLPEEQDMLETIAQRTAGVQNRLHAQEALVGMENEMNRQFHLSQVGLLASGITHNLRTPLTLISMATSMAREDAMSILADSPDDSGQLRSALRETVEALDKVTDASVRISGAVDDIMSYHQKNSQTVDLSNLNEILRTDAAMLKSDLDIKHQIEMRLELLDEEISVAMKPSDISQMFLNLTSNARDAMLGRKKRIMTIRSGVHSQEAYAWFEVQDTGKGIPGDVIDKLGQPFFTTKRNDKEARKRGSGTGLGIYMIKRLLNQCGGWLEVDSKPGDTRIRLMLPRAQVATGAVEEQ